MYEFTKGGMWFRWHLLDRVSKRLAAASLLAAAVALIPRLSSQTGYQLGRALGRDETPLRATVDWAAWHGWWIIAFSTLSGLLWWRFSLRQDEMFNRVQNWSLGMAGAWGGALLMAWALLALANAAAPISPRAVLALFGGLSFLFWFVAVRRWAL